MDVLCANRAWRGRRGRGRASVGARIVRARDSASVAGRVEGVPRVRCAPSRERLRAGRGLPAVGNRRRFASLCLSVEALGVPDTARPRRGKDMASRDASISACDSWLSRASLDRLAQPSRPVCPRAWTAAGSYGWTGEALLRGQMRGQKLASRCSRGSLSCRFGALRRACFLRVSVLAGDFPRRPAAR